MRLSEGGLIDRTRPLTLQVDGSAVPGFAGDTLASALLASGRRLMGRSFKYHRPRGLIGAGPEEPNALYTIGTGAFRLPNTRASVQEAYDGLVASSQNRWPGLSFDLMAVNDLMAPFLAAGFYYKTFMWPRAFWERVYEPLIRRAAGLGRLSRTRDPGESEKAWAFCDLLVIGAGPAGLSAALTAARWGARVILAEEDFVAGGRLNGEEVMIGGQAGRDWAASALAELEGLPNVRVMLRTSVTSLHDNGTFGALERVSDHLAEPEGRPEQCFWRIVAKRAVLATGAHERMIAFPGNDRPGVMLAGAVRTFLHRFAVVPGARVAVFTANDDGARTARDLRARGVTVAALIDARPGVTHDLDVPQFPGGQVTGTSGRLGLSAVNILRAGGGIARIEADVLAVSGGWNPALHLACHLNGRPEWREDIAAFVPRPGMAPGLSVTGAANGSFSTRAALAEGEMAARLALKELGRKVAKSEVPEAPDDAGSTAAFWAVRAGRGPAFLDFQNDVTVKDVELAARENFTHAEHMKRYTTLGMSTDQGKTGGVPGLAILAEATGRTLAETGTTTSRPPMTPIRIAALGAGAKGQGFAPSRLTPAHGFARARGASMLEAGLWHRAAWFPRTNEAGWRESCDREAGYVRQAVGVADVSTLGKIDLKGPDVGLFLDRVYTGTFSTLKPGRVKYGLMLREDGVALDDGTCARLSPAHWLMTTTTAAAGVVMAHLEFARECLWPGLDLAMTSVSDQWAQFSVAGPRAQTLVAGLLDLVPDDAVLPHLGVLETPVLGIPARLFRLSFSGERAYEIAVPARFGQALMEELVRRAEALGGGAYGLEALNVLRIEKGFLTHAEIDGRVGAADLGLEKMMAKGKDFIGKVMAARPAMGEADRPRLIGLKPLEPGAELRAGAHLVEDGAEARAGNDRGWISSACYSPALGHAIALGFLAGGRARNGTTVIAADPLRGAMTRCLVTDPVFVDPAGERLHG